MRRSAKPPHQGPPPIFWVNWESRTVALKEYEPFMGTFLHLKLDNLSVQGLYFDYLGSDMVALSELEARDEDAVPKMTLRSPFQRVQVMFTGPWDTNCFCKGLKEEVWKPHSNLVPANSPPAQLPILSRSLHIT